jgi:hypothetical protein
VEISVEIIFRTGLVDAIFGRGNPHGAGRQRLTAVFSLSSGDNRCILQQFTCFRAASV